MQNYAFVPFIHTYGIHERIGVLLYLAPNIESEELRGQGPLKRVVPPGSWTYYFCAQNELMNVPKTRPAI